MTSYSRGGKLNERGDSQENACGVPLESRGKGMRANGSKRNTFNMASDGGSDGLPVCTVERSFREVYRVSGVLATPILRRDEET